MTHDELVRRAIVWLRSKRYDPVLCGIASCDEIPDAIGWKSGGSCVIECKTSKSDFHADKWKYIGYKGAHSGYTLPGKNPRMRARYEKEGLERIQLPRMGTRRWYMSEPGIVTAEMVKADHPDHGLLWVQGKRANVIIEAPERRDHVASRSEVRYLRFALVHLSDNLGKRGISCNLLTACLFFGDHGIDVKRA